MYQWKEDGIQLGNLAEWIAALGTVAALFFALVVLKGEQEARREAKEDRRLRYAGGVTAWLEKKTLREGEPPEDYEVEMHWQAYVTNAGETPVYKCVLLVGPIEPRDDPQLQIDRIKLEAGTLAPGQTREDYVHPGWLEDEWEAEPFVELEFTDSTGRSWRRLADGSLEEAPSPKSSNT